MMNKNVEELVRDHYCLRNADTVRVEFLMSNRASEIYETVDIIDDLSGHISIRTSEVSIDKETLEATFKNKQEIVFS